jgi:hypothetical protein
VQVEGLATTRLTKTHKASLNEQRQVNRMFVWFELYVVLTGL